MSRRRSSTKGVTLLEMLVVVGIVAILMGVSYPSIAASVDSVRLATAADSTAAFLNSALNRAEARHQVLELTIAKKENHLLLRSADPSFRKSLELPTGVKILEILPVGFASQEEGRVFYLIPGGAAPRMGVALVNARGARRTVWIDPITSAPEIRRE
jgi:prepilin-type N-terminal cleavage/methylation domain-containing protein